MPGPVAVDLGTSSPRSSFEEIQHPSYAAHSYVSDHPHNQHHGNPSSWSSNPPIEELPMHYITDEKARRRIIRPVGPGSSPLTSPHEPPPNSIHGVLGDGGEEVDDDGGKEVYRKMRAAAALRQIPHSPPTSFQEDIIENLPAAIYTLLSCWTRFYQIGKNNHVVWDEAHFGKFGSYYLRREFYFDVHPPLGKMIVGLVGLLSGYNGHFEFKSGDQYTDEVPYVAMRVMLATFGVLMVPLAWYTSRELGFSRRASHLTTIMVLCDVAWLCISRFILLDSMLLFFTVLTVFCLTKFHSERHDPFSPDWWIWLTFTGGSIGCVASVKWVGLFVTALVGLYTIEDLWEKFGDLRMRKRDYVNHWIARIAMLMVLPLCIYMMSFKLHFLILNHSGPGDAQMSSLFQANLEGNDFSKNPLEIAFGSKITLKNMGFGGGLLHSHTQTYPVGSQQQQVTCYHYKDDNNHWRVEKPWSQPKVNDEGEIEYLKDGDIIRLLHTSTNKNLHSHTVSAPLTKLNNEVSGYGNETAGDQGDHWLVEVVDDMVLGKKQHVSRVRSLTTKLRFRHVQLGCYLVAPNSILPPWGFKQIEVSCDKENNPGDPHSHWNVESHWNGRLPIGETKFYRSPFLRDFWHLNVAMMTSNNALIPDADKEDILASSPTDWPWVHLGLRMCGWGDNQTKYYLIGHPIIWWSSTASLGLCVVLICVYLIRLQRGYRDWGVGEWDHFLYVCKIAGLGWVFQYVPFLIMGRVTYIHHYLPTLYFAVLMVNHLFDHLIFKSRWLKERTKWVIFGLAAGIVIGVFWWFRGVAFGIDGPIKEHKGLLWRKSWNIYESH
ncbi:Protein O-mannosyltransferase 2 [Serendipita sp. 411]|nr:Protein O-mannosyltransferase 2 [Serendipita sp. 411]